jgi:hypothetical protein
MLKDKDFNPMNNRDFVSFTFKTIAAPLVISSFKNINKNIMLTELSNRYNKYVSDGVFNGLLSEIESKYSCTFPFGIDTLKTEASRIFDGIQKIYDKMSIDYSFQKYSVLNLRLNFEDFKENCLKEEQIKKIISLEFNIKKNGKANYEEIPYKTFDDIPASILSKFDIKETKYDNTNLKRYIKEITKDTKPIQTLSLDIADKINYSYRDLCNVNVDLTPLPVEVLKAMFLWDIDRDSKITINYLHFMDSVKKCTLSKDMVISLLTDIQDKIDVDFVDSFMVTR